MHKAWRLVAGWAAAVALAWAVAVPAALAAPSPAPSGPVLDRLVLPREVWVGEPFLVEARVLRARGGVRNASALLRSPNGQEVTVRLAVVPGTSRLQAAVALSEYAEDGPWRVASLYLADNGGNKTLLEDGRGLDQSFVVVADDPPDLTAPTVRRVAVTPARVDQGAEITVQVAAGDDLSGVAAVQAWLAPLQSGADWEVLVRLHYNPEFRRWEGRVPAPFLTGLLQLIRVDATDAAGNRLRWTPPPGALHRVAVVPRRLSVEYTPGSELELFIDKPLYFVDWQSADQQRVLGYLERLAEPRLRDRLTGELEQLARAAQALRREMHSGDALGLAVAGPATTGKAFAVAGAIKARLLLLLEQDRLTGARPALPVLSAAGLRQAYAVEDHPGAVPAPREATERAGPALTEFIVRTLRTSGLGAGTLGAPHQGRGWSEPDFLPDGALWVSPHVYPRAVGEHRAATDLEVVLSLDPLFLQDPVLLGQTVVHELGHHVHQALLGSFDADRPLWSRYLFLRGGQPDPGEAVEHDGQPEENFAEDIAYLYGPPDVVAQYYDRLALTPQSYPLLVAEPAMATTMRRLLTDALAAPRLPALAVTAPDAEFTVLDTPRLTVAGTWAPGHEVEVYWSDAYPEELLGGDYSYKSRDRMAVAVGPDGKFAAEFTGLPPGVPVQVVVEGLDASGERHRVKVLMVLVKPE